MSSSLQGGAVCRLQFVTPGSIAVFAPLHDIRSIMKSTTAAVGGEKT